MPSYVVTGASRGLGREFVRQLAAIDANTVFGLVRNKETSIKLIQLVEGRANVHILQADITDHKALKAAAASVSAVTGGTLDVLINNAAYADNSPRSGRTLDGYPEGEEHVLEADFRKNFDVNVIGIIHTINAFLPLVRAGATKKVITLSTGLADHELTMTSGNATYGPYSVSKAALNMVNTKYAAEYADQGFVFLAVSPGLVATAEEAPTPEQLKTFSAMRLRILKIKPDFTGPITPEESVKLQLALFDTLTAKHNGEFLSHHGNKEWL